MALGKTATASSIDTSAANFGAQLAIDGNAASRWASQYTDAQWLTVDLGVAARLCNVRLTWETAYAKSYQIQGSTDGLNWRPLIIEANGDGGIDQHSINSTDLWRYVRMQGVSRATAWGYSLFEFEVNGVISSLPTAKFSLPPEVKQGVAVSFDASLSKDPGGRIQSYEWDFGDGFKTSLATPFTQHTFTAAGDVVVTLKVVDSDGNSATVQQTIKAASNQTVDVMKGKQIWDTTCRNCHTVGQDFLIKDAAKLAKYISGAMPLNKPGSCAGSCAIDVTAYIMTWLLVTEKPACMDEQPNPRALRLLSNSEYQNTVNDLFGISALQTITSTFPGSARAATTAFYDNNAIAERVNETRMGAYWEAAKTIADSVATNKLNIFVGCTTRDAVCGSSFVENFGLKAFRRPLTVEEKAAYVKLFMAGNNLADGAKKVIKSVLISPVFLYRPEQGVGSSLGTYQLTPYETATLLAFTFTASTPDAELLTAAAANQLQSRDQLVGQVQRLLKKPAAINNMANFARQWLLVTGYKDVSKNTTTYPNFAGVKDAMGTELDKYLSSVLLGSDTFYSQLYKSDYTYANPILAQYYGLSGGTADFGKTNTAGERGGILKLGAWLSTQAKADDTSPVLRGVFVRKRLLCQELKPPVGLNITIPKVDPTKTTRERFKEHSANAVCAGCHQYIDDLGFGFDTFDGAGKLVSNPDDYGVISGLNDINGGDVFNFKGVHELSTILSVSHAGAECVVEQFQVYATGQAEPDRCAVARTADRWKSHQYAFQDLWNEIVSSETFLIRR